MNEVHVTDSTDAAATQKMAHKRLRSKSYRAMQGVSCQCVDGVLILRGLVTSYFLKQIAQEAVARLAGVRLVENQIEVAPAIEN